MSRNFASPHTDRDSLYAPLRRADELPGHVITEELAELHNAHSGAVAVANRAGRAARLAPTAAGPKWARVRMTPTPASGGRCWPS